MRVQLRTPFSKLKPEYRSSFKCYNIPVNKLRFVQKLTVEILRNAGWSFGLVGGRPLATEFQGSLSGLNIGHPVVWRHWEAEGSTLSPQGL